MLYKHIQAKLWLDKGMSFVGMHGSDHQRKIAAMPCRVDLHDLSLKHTHTAQERTLTLHENVFKMDIEIISPMDLYNVISMIRFVFCPASS